MGDRMTRGHRHLHRRHLPTIAPINHPRGIGTWTRLAPRGCLGKVAAYVRFLTTSPAAASSIADPTPGAGMHRVSITI